MSELKYVDQVLEPKSSFSISAKIEEPFKAVKKIKDILKEDMEIGSTGIFEDKLKWDDTGEVKSFYYIVRGERKFDDWTKLEVTLIFSGKQKKDGREGEVDILIIPKLITSFKVSPFTKPFWKKYFEMFYKKKREEDKLLSLKIAKRIKADLERVLGIAEEREVL